MTGAGHYEQGTTATLTATAAERYSFANWTRNGEVVSTSPVYSFTVNEDYLLVANFRMMVPDIPDEPSDFDETKLYTLRTLHGYLSQSEELTGDGNGRSFLHSVPDKAEAGRFRIKGFKNKYTIYNEDLGRYLTAYGTAKTPYADEPDGSFTIYPAIDSGGSRMAWVIKSNTTDRWMNLGEIYLNNNIISGVDDDTQWFIEEYDETEEPNLPSAFDESVNYVLRTARGFLPRAERLASDNGFGDLWHIYSALDNYTAGQFRITGSEGAYHIYNLDLDKYLSADGTGNAAYVDQPDGTFSLITATDFGGKDNAWIIKSNVTGNWMMFGGSNQFLNNDGWNHADAGDQWYIEEVPPVGDMNGDGRVDVLDVTTLIDFINGKPTNGLTTALADINGDGRVDHLDLATLISIIIGK